jgi:hypothetical protein
VCRFHVAAGAKLRPKRGAIYKLSGAVAKLASINLQKLVLSPTGSINLGFILREDLLVCSSYLPLGVPNWAVIYTPSLRNKAYSLEYSTSPMVFEVEKNFGAMSMVGAHGSSTQAERLPREAVVAYGGILGPYMMYDHVRSQENVNATQLGRVVSLA